MKKCYYLFILGICCFADNAVFAQRYESINYWDAISLGKFYGKTTFYKLDLANVRFAKYWSTGLLSIWSEDFSLLNKLWESEAGPAFGFFLPFGFHYPIYSRQYTSIGVESRLYWLPTNGSTVNEDLPRFLDLAFRFEMPMVVLTAGHRFELEKWKSGTETIKSFSGPFFEIAVGLSAPIDFENEKVGNRWIKEERAYYHSGIYYTFSFSTALY